MRPGTRQRVRHTVARTRGPRAADPGALRDELVNKQLALEDQLLRISHSVPGLLCSLRLRPDGTSHFPFTTPAVKDLLGVSQEALARDSDPFLAHVHPDDRDRVERVHAEAVRTIRPCHVEFRYVHPTHGVRWIEGWSEPKAEPDGSVVCHAFMMDVTERKQSEEALRASESKYRALYQFTPVMMHSIDREGRLVDVNGCWLETLGYERAEVIGRRSVEFLTPESREYAEKVVLPAYFKSGTCKDIPYRFIKKSGEVIDVLLSAIAERDGEGHFVRSLAVIVDITARKRAEEALREVDRRKDQFLAVLSHELRNPLAPIHNALFMLDRAGAEGDQTTRARAVLGRQVGHLTRLVDDLLDVTRITRGKIQLRRSRFDLRELVARTVEDHRQLLTEREIELEVSTAPGPLPVDADAARVAQVVSNLLQNSSKFTDYRGRISVLVERDGSEAVVTVRDTGMGISPDMLTRVFEPFTQADHSLHRSRGGLGLGLALVKGLVELHGGSTEARSGGLGLGTELVVRLPLAKGEERRPARHAGEKVPIPPRRILIVEDNIDAAETLREMLEADAHQVEIAHDGRQGLEKAHAFRPDVVLCDIGLPEMDGYAVARAIRSDRTLASTSLVALTGYALPEDHRRATEAGFDRHLAKPVSLAQIEEVLAGGSVENAR